MGTLLILAAVFGVSIGAFAEGSKDLCDTDRLPATGTTVHDGLGAEVKFDQSGTTNGNNPEGRAYRPYLEWKQGLQFGLARRNVIYAYVQAGETVYFGSSVTTSNGASAQAVFYAQDKEGGNGDYVAPSGFNNSGAVGATVAVTMPNAKDSNSAYQPCKSSKVSVNGLPQTGYDQTTVYFYKPNTSTMYGVINTREKEVNGPKVTDLAYKAEENKTRKENPSLGYEPFSFTAPVTGVYSFRFLAAQYTAKGTNPSTDNKGKLIDAEFYNTENNMGAAAWDITVVKDENGTPTVQEGRVGANTLFVNMGGHRRGLFAKLYTVTYDGFMYEYNLNGLQPWGFVMYSNNRGFLFDKNNLAAGQGSGRPAETPWQSYDYAHPVGHSFYSKDSSGADVGAAPEYEETTGFGIPITDINGNPIKSSILNNVSPVDAVRDRTNKLMFNKPDDAFIKAATKNGRLTEKYDDINSEVSVADMLSYTGAGLQNPVIDEDGTSYGNYGQGGTFTLKILEADFKSLVSTTFNITLDFSKYSLDDKKKPVKNEDGTWKINPDYGKLSAAEYKAQYPNESGNKKELSMIVHIGENVVTWQGEDAYNNAVPRGKYDSVANCYWEAGTAHFPMLDVEYNPNGITVTRLNRIEDKETTDEFEQDRYTVFYNNEGTPKFTDPARWYYFKSAKYPSRIADGQNASAGISSKDGVMKYYGYVGKDATGGVYDYAYDSEGNQTGTKILIGNIGTPSATTASPNGNGYGEATAVDVWTRYVTEQKAKMTIGVKAERQMVSNPALVSFVGEEKDTMLRGRRSHIMQNEGVLKEVVPKNYVIGGERGNTISTGFISSISDGDTANIKEYNHISWEIVIPIGDQDYTYTTMSGVTVTAKGKETYIKVPEYKKGKLMSVGETEELMVKLSDLFGDEVMDATVSLGAEDEITEIGGDNGNGGIDDTTAVQLINDEYTAVFTAGSVYVKLEPTAILEDSDKVPLQNKGKIYKITGIKPNDGGTTLTEYKALKLHFRYKISENMVQNGGQAAIYGLIIDEFYAPNAYADVYYYKDSEEEEMKEKGGQDFTDQTYEANRNTKYDYNPAFVYEKSIN